MKYSFKIKIKHVFVLFFLLYLVKTTNDLRYNMNIDPTGKITLDYSFLNPFASNKNIYDENDIIYFRLNGVDLASDFFKINGLLNFEPEVFNHIYKMNIEPIFSSDEYRNIAKNNAFTTIKILLQRKYTGINNTDTFSCILSDIFGGFGIIGVFILSLIISFIFYFIKLLYHSENYSLQIFSIFLVIIFINFETEFFGDIQNFILLLIPTFIISNNIIKFGLK